MKAQDVMSHKVVTVTPDATVTEIAGLLVERHISAVPVIDAEGTLLGIVSEGDLIRQPDIAGEPRLSWWLAMISDPAKRAKDYAKTHANRADEVMTKEVVTVNEATPIADIAHLIEEHRIKRVPVMRNGELVGIVARADLVRALAVRQAPAEAPGRLEDRTLRMQLQKLQDEQHWDAELFNVVV